MQQPPSATVLVTGGAGWLAQRVVKRLSSQDGIKVICTYNSTVPPAPPLPSVTYVQMNVTDEHQCMQVLSAHRPTAILHLAALTNTSKCQSDPAGAMRVNAPLELFRAIGATDPTVRLVFCSTDLVYDGGSPPYAAVLPDALPPPLNAYAQSKLAGERAALACVGDCLVLRLSNMVGSGGGKFLDFLRASMASGSSSAHRPTGLRADERRSFVWVEDVCALLCLLGAGASGGARGVFNVGGPAGLSRLELGLLVAAAEGRAVVVMDSGSSASDVPDQGAGTEAEAGPWVVVAQAAATHPPAFPSPLDVTMDSGTSSATFGVLFADMKSCLGAEAESGR